MNLFLNRKRIGLRVVYLRNNQVIEGKGAGV